MAGTLCAAVAAQPAPASDADAKAGSTPNAAPVCDASCFAPRSAVDTIARAVAAGIGPVPDGTLVLSAALESDIQAPRGDRLAVQLAEHVAGRLGPAVKHDSVVRTLEQAREHARAAPAFVLLLPKIQNGRLHLAADGYRVPRSVWARARAQQPGPGTHVFSQAPVDAEVRSYLRPLRFGEPQVSQFDGADPGIVALACGDIDDDGSTDVVTMTRGRILHVALQDGRVTRRREARWKDLSPLAGAPLQQPLGFVTIVEAATASSGKAHIDVSLSDRANSLRLDAALAVQQKFKGFAVPSGRSSACTRIVDLLLAKTFVSCDPNDVPPTLAKVRGDGDAIASSFFVRRGGDGVAPVAIRTSNALVVRTGEEDQVIGRVGAQLAVGDLDQDGALDVVNSQDVLTAKRDALEVRTLLASGTIERRYRVPMPTGVEAVAVCPPDGPGVAPIVVASAGKLWVIR